MSFFFFFSVFSLQGSPPPPHLDFGLCARVSPAVCEPAIPFSNWSAVSHLKSRDFRFHEPTILFSNWSAVSHLKSRDFRFHEPTILFSNWSAVSHLKSRDFRFHEPTIPFTTGQRYPIPLPVMTSLDQSEARTIAIWAHFTTYTNIPYY